MLDEVAGAAWPDWLDMYPPSPNTISGQVWCCIVIVLIYVKNSFEMEEHFTQ
jgi:hypothetical protein